MYYAKDVQRFDTTSTTDKIYTCKDLVNNSLHIIFAYLSFSGSAQLFATAIIDTSMFLRGDGNQVVLHDTVNGQTGYITRKSNTSIALRTSDVSWQLSVNIY